MSEKCGLLFSFPTELEWEYAAKGGTASKELKFAGSDSIDEVAWYRGNSKETTHPVGQKKPNELGLYDMCGNVWEWVEIPHSSSKAVRKGGSWWQEPHNCEITSREVSELTSKSSAFGLRVVLHDFEKSGKAR